MFDRFQIVEAYYIALSLAHEGQGSDKYRRLSKLMGYFKPSPLLSYDRCCEDTREAVDTLLARWGCPMHNGET
jgi:hypothetical protein